MCKFSIYGKIDGSGDVRCQNTYLFMKVGLRALPWQSLKVSLKFQRMFNVCDMNTEPPFLYNTNMYIYMCRVNEAFVKQMFFWCFFLYFLMIYAQPNSYLMHGTLSYIYLCACILYFLFIWLFSGKFLLMQDKLKGIKMVDAQK